MMMVMTMWLCVAETWKFYRINHNLFIIWKYVVENDGILGKAIICHSSIATTESSTKKVLSTIRAIELVVNILKTRIFTVSSVWINVLQSDWAHATLRRSFADIAISLKKISENKLNRCWCCHVVPDHPMLSLFHTKHTLNSFISIIFILLETSKSFYTPSIESHRLSNMFRLRHMYKTKHRRRKYSLH